MHLGQGLSLAYIEGTLGTTGVSHHRVWPIFEIVNSPDRLRLVPEVTLGTAVVQGSPLLLDVYICLKRGVEQKNFSFRLSVLVSLSN